MRYHNKITASILSLLTANFALPCLADPPLAPTPAAIHAANPTAPPPQEPAIVRLKSTTIPINEYISHTDIRTEVLSDEAVQLGHQLGLIDKLTSLGQLRERLKTTPDDRSLKEEYLDLKSDITDTIEQTRLEIDYARAELYTEATLQNEMVRAFTRDRDERVMRSNVQAFRTNGALWTVAEALTIPTFRNPSFAIPSGIIGIMAGVVPTIFSAIAMHESAGPHFERQARPNMLAALFSYPITPRVDYPDSVWRYMHSPPSDGTSKDNRIDILIRQWQEDKNIHMLANKLNRSDLDILTGATKQRLTIDLLSDRVNMLEELNALVGLMNRPLLELMMAVRGSKHVPAKSTN